MIGAAFVLAGGLGTRLRAITGDRCPKPMVPVAWKGRSYPFLEFPLAHLRSQGIRDVTLCIGHLGGQIAEHFGDGARFGLRIHYHDAGAADSGSRLSRAVRGVDLGAFLAVCGDVYHPLPLDPFARHFERHEEWSMLLAVGGPSAESPPNLVVAPDGRVTASGAVDGRIAGAAVEAGTLALRRSALDGFDPGGDFSLTADVYPALIARGALGAQRSDAPFYDIGTPAGYRRFCARVAAGGVAPLSEGAA